MSTPQTEFDYIVVGGGTAGCVVAARLHEAHPSLSIALIEAGEDATSDPRVQDPRQAQSLNGTSMHWTYTSTEQAHLGGRTLTSLGGKLLSGSSAVNYTGWTRGNAADYDRWAALVGDSRWSYASMLPAFKRSEHWHNPGADTAHFHGFEGPIRTQTVDVGFPLREPMREAYESIGFPYNHDMNSGDPNGVSPIVTTWHELKRQYAAACYPLDGVHILCNTVVSKILLEEKSKRATGVEIVGEGGQLRARKEVIISCGAIRTPQLLLLSGIGPKSELDKHRISMMVHSPDVGRNLVDHHGVSLFFKLKHPERGLALGSPAFNKPEYAHSLPTDWIITGKAPQADLQKATAVDGTRIEPGSRSDFELIPTYLANGREPNPPIPFNGEYITCQNVCLSSTSRGTVTLRSTNPHDNPVFDPNSLSTEHDRAVMRAAMRTTMDAMSSAPLAPFLEPGEIPPPGRVPLSKSSTDAELDERITALAVGYYHPMGTAAMGHVVDSECRVKGTQGLRVVDASIIPLAMSAHLQAPVYGLAEHAAAIIAQPVAK